MLNNSQYKIRLEKILDDASAMADGGGFNRVTRRAVWLKIEKFIESMVRESHFGANNKFFIDAAFTLADTVYLADG